MARLIERRLGRSARRRILDHAADCVSCRRQLAVASLPEIGPVRASLAQALTSERLAVIVAVVLLPIVLWMIGSPSADPAPSPRAAAPRRFERPSAPTILSTAPAPIEASIPAPAVESPLVSSPRVEGRSDVARDLLARETPPPDIRPSESPRAKPPVRETAVTGIVPAPPEEPPIADPDVLIRQTILDPFGSLALEGAGGRVPIQTTSVVPVDGRLTALGRPSGFRLADGTRLQLAAGSAVSVFHHVARRCSGLTLHQGALLVDAVAAQPLFLRREKSAGLLEGFAGAIHLNAGPRPDAIALTAVGSGGVWRRQGHAAVEISAGDQLNVEADGQDVSRRVGKARPPTTRFAAWPEQPTTLFFANFEPDVHVGERPLVVQGTAREGYVSAVVNSRKKVIELSVPSSVLGSSEAVVRLRFRTTAVRIQCNASRAIQPVPFRSRSETAWTTLTFSLGGDGDGWGRSRRDRRGSVTFTVEAPPRVSVEDLVFDLDEIEILRS